MDCSKSKQRGLFNVLDPGAVLSCKKMSEVMPCDEKGGLCGVGGVVTVEGSIDI